MTSAAPCVLGLASAALAAASSRASSFPSSVIHCFAQIIAIGTRARASGLSVVFCFREECGLGARQGEKRCGLRYLEGDGEREKSSR